MVIFHSYVSLPEGKTNKTSQPDQICQVSSIMACAQMRLPDSMAQYKGEID